MDSTTAIGYVTEIAVANVTLSVVNRVNYGTRSPFRVSLAIPHTHLEFRSLPANHPCPLPCHAPAACPEDEPCRATINISCPCGRIRQPVACGRSTSNPAGREGSQQLKCTNECAIAKRNARLAEALGINTEAKSAQVTYTDDLVGFAKANIKFCQLVEKTFAE